MPDFIVSPTSILNQIKSNLQDRYDSGFPILKELLQNADDSRSGQICVDALPGWPDAVNPLLRGPGLLVANDGEFRKEDERGITSFGESSKSTDSAAIGKFGFGQKAVFHFCDAFVAYAFGNDYTFSTVVNPFLKVEVKGNITPEWEPLSDSDLALLRSAVGRGFRERSLVVWLPLRREGLEPAPGVGFSTNRPTSSQTIDELARPDELRAILAGLRHLEGIELREGGQQRIAVGISESTGRLLGPDRWSTGWRAFGGMIESGSGGSKDPTRFVGREAAIVGTRLDQLRQTQHWPSTISVLSAQPEPEKGAPHGAATLLRVRNPARSELKISWAVFLPVGEKADLSFEFGDVGLGQFRLLLHGYFFLDSGRRHIEGLADRREDGNPVDAASLRRTWNAELRDTVVLPLIPGVLRDSLDGQMVTSAELATVVAAIAKSDWFRAGRSALCRTEALVRVFESSNAVVWRLVSPQAKLRPLPRGVIDAPARLTELIPNILAWAQDRDVVLCVDESASLTSRAMLWEPDELSSMLTELSPRGFQSGSLAPLLIDFLAVIGSAETVSQAVGPRLASALRKAMQEQSVLATAENLSVILALVPAALLFRLPPSVEHRHVLRTMASTGTHVLPVRGVWLGENYRSPRLTDGDLEALLGALEPLIDGDHADDAATAALAMLVNAEHQLEDLARRPKFAGTKVLRARDVRARSVLAISLQILLDRSRAGLLFGSSPDANSFLPLLVNAIPDANPLIVEGRTAEFLKDRAGSALSVLPASKAAVLAVINRASAFGPELDRSVLLDRLRPSEEDDRGALRRLCAGAAEAGALDADLWVLDDAPGDLERLIKDVLGRSDRAFLVPSRVASELTQKTRSRLGIRSFDTPGLEALFDKYADIIPELRPTESERESFLLTDLPDSLLRRLPIHGRSDGSIGKADDGLFREADWAVPASLRQHVLTVRLSRNPQARRRQESLIRAWSPQAQIETVLALGEPSMFQAEILDALAEIFDRNANLSQDLTRLLRERPWLFVEGAPVSAQDIFALPQPIDQAARAVLLPGGERPAFFPADQLPNDVRLHRAFKALEKHILPDQRSSFDALGLIIDDAGLVGRLGGAEDFPLDDFTLLAKAGVDLALPGWPLLASILTAAQEDREQTHKIISSFSQVQGSDQAAHHLDALSTVADERGRTGEAARRAYRHGFDAVAAWPDESRRRVFWGTRVPTEAGGWRSGREVLEDGNGVAQTHVLAREYASQLRKRQDGYAHQPVASTASSDPGSAQPSHRGDIKLVDLTEIEAQCAGQHRAFLQPWRGRVPSDLVITYLGLIGRFPAIRELAGEWVTDATFDVETLWADLDRRLGTALYPNPLPREVDERRFLIEHVDALHVRALAMSGAIIDAPLTGGSDGILVGNLHKRNQGIRSADGTVRSLITLPLRAIEVAAFGQSDASSIFRSFVEVIATDCLWLSMADQQNAVHEILDKAVEVDQATLEETERLLRDRLPTILAELKLPTSSRAQQALRDFQANESRMNRLFSKADERDDLKNKLWEHIQEPVAVAELLGAVRSKIKDFGYSPSRVLFELFQNADDAYRQLDETTDEARFRVELSTDNQHGFRVVHWGRPINHLGANADDGRRLGHDRDLLNMLLMNFSEKRAEEDLTGKFGLGFKSVHVLSDSVGVASGFIALRTRGGFLPAAWHDGLDEVESRKRGDGRKATLIDVPFTRETAVAGADAVRAFRSAMAWLPAFSRRIRRVEIAGEQSARVECRPLLNDRAIQVVEVQDGIRQRALRIDLGGRVSLLLRIDRAGPSNFPEELRRVWNLAPLEEDLRSGWLLNGPFAVDPGRGRLAGSIESHQEVFKRLGRQLGERLLSLYDLAAGDWQGFAKALDLDSSENYDRTLFWSRLFDVFGRDLDDDLAKHIHADGHGYGRLAAERAVVPTRLPQPFDEFVRASDVEHSTGGPLADHAVLTKLQAWTSLLVFKGSIVARDVAERLENFGFRPARSVTLSTLLQQEMSQEKRIDAEAASRLGEVITLEAIESEPMRTEKYEILEVAKQSHFCAQDGTWRPVRDLSSVRCGNQDEEMRCAFAPESALLHTNYSDTGVEFFRVARAQSGYGPKPPLLLGWAVAASDIEKQRAVLRYILSGEQRSGLAQEMRRSMPPWMPQPIEGLLRNELLNGWSEDDKKKLLLELGGGHLFGIVAVAPMQPEPETDPEEVLKAIHAWWEMAKESERAEYAKRLYPEFFAPLHLGETDDRTAWFTMFALACFQSFGRTQDGQHRGFLERGRREGWWEELANSRPPTDVNAWIVRLQGWSSPLELEQSFLPWRRAFVDLYTVARWLDEYVEIVRKLPRIVQHHGPISLNDILRPSFSPLLAPLGIDAAPLNRSLGIGLNWMIREMLRSGFYEAEEQQLMAPYCWAPTKRVRELLVQLGARVDDTANKEASRVIHAFVVEKVGAELARFDGDFDLPLQIATRAENRQVLEDCFEQAGGELPLEQYGSTETDEWGTQ